MNRRILIPLVFHFVYFAAICACSPQEGQTSPEHGEISRLAVVCDGFDDGKGEGSKSRFSEDGLKLRNFNIWVYDSGGELVNGVSSGLKTYFNGAGCFDGGDVFPNAYDDFDVYILANIGEISPLLAPATKRNADSYRRTFDYGSFERDGFPMASHLKLCPAFCDGRLPVKPLVARYDIRVVNDTDADYQFKLKSLTACNCAKAVSPFSDVSEASSSSDVCSEADFFVSGTDDFSGRTGTLYLLENIQGEVFSDAQSRIPSGINSGKGACASYLQFEGTYRQKDDTGYETMTCRYYFGQGREAYVKRNCRTELTLKLTSGILGRDNWTVEPVDWFNRGKVIFSPSSLTLSSGKSSIVDVGTYDSSGSANQYVKYTLSYDASAFAQAQLRMEYRPSGSSLWRSYSSEQIQGPCSIRTGTSYSGLGSRTVNINAKGPDGSVLSPDPLIVKAVGYPYPTAIRLETTDFKNMQTDGLLEFSVTYSDGTVKRIAGKDSGLSLSKLSGAVTVKEGSNGWGYHLSSGDYYDYCSVRAIYRETVGTTLKTVSEVCYFSIWALDAESRDTRYNCFQDSGKSASTSNNRDYYVSAKKISTYGTVFGMSSATLCLTNGKISKVIDVAPQSHEWEVVMNGQSSHKAFSLVNSNTAVSIRKSGNIVGANASFVVKMRSGYRDADGNYPDVQSFSITVVE